MQMLMRCLRRQMVLESRQTIAGQNSLQQQQIASQEIISGTKSPKHGIIISHKIASDQAEEFQHFDQTYSNAEDEPEMQPVTQCQLLSNMTNAVDTKNFMKPNPKKQDQEHTLGQRQAITEDDQGTKPPMMTRAEIYAVLSENLESHEKRMNPLKGKFFFGSSLRLYGGSRWSKLRKRAQNQSVEDTYAVAGKQFDLEEEDNQKEYKRSRVQEPNFCEENTEEMADGEFNDTISADDTQRLHSEISAVQGYQGNWKATQPAFIVITNSLFTSHY